MKTLVDMTLAELHEELRQADAAVAAAQFQDVHSAYVAMTEDGRARGAAAHAEIQRRFGKVANG